MLNRRQLLSILGLTVASSQLTYGAHAAPVRKLTNGVDISWLPDVEAAGGKFFTQFGKRISPIPLLAKNKIKVGRIRLWVNPVDAHGSLERALKLAKRLKAQGMQVCLDFHFSDTWADPGHQQTPAAWSDLPINELSDRLYEYVESTLKTFKRNGISPQWVQLGNEITNGMLWPLGAINSNDAGQWSRLSKLHNAASAAMRNVTPQAKSILHLDCGGDFHRVKWWLEQADAYGIDDYDVVGLSFYPQWHGTFADLKEVLEHIAITREQKVLVAETAYPWTNRRFGSDVINVDHPPLSGCSYTPAGQVAFVKKLQTLLLALPKNRGVGIWWWEGLSTRVGSGSAIRWNGGMANSTLVDTTRTALPSLIALGQK